MTYPYEQPNNPVTPPVRPAGSVPPPPPYFEQPHNTGLAIEPTADTGTDGWSEDDLHVEPTKPTPDEVYNSLNYFDELAIKRCFGAEPLALKQQPGAFMRSLVFSLLRKEQGLKDKPAQDLVFEMPNSDVYGHFHIEKPPAKCIDKACPCAEHVDDEDDDEDPTQPLS